MFLVVVAALALAARAYSRRQLGDARAQARHWVERLGAELLVLDAAAVLRRAVDPAGLGKLLSDSPPPMPSWRPRGPDGSAGSLRTLPSKGCTTFGRRDGRSASIPALGYLVREWWTPSVRRWPAGAGRCRGWPRRSWLMRASVPGRCPPVLPCRPTGSARSSSNGCVPGPVGADRYLTPGNGWIRGCSALCCPRRRGPRTPPSIALRTDRNQEAAWYAARVNTLGYQVEIAQAA